MGTVGNGMAGVDKALRGWEWQRGAWQARQGPQGPGGAGLVRRAVAWQGRRGRDRYGVEARRLAGQAWLGTTWRCVDGHGAAGKALVDERKTYMGSA